MVTRKLPVINKLGLHARAAAKLVNLAGTFKSDIKLRHKDQDVDAKSIMGIMMLAAAQGSTIEMAVSGDDEDAAAEQIGHLFANRFGELE